VLIGLDASHLERNLYYATQVIELGYPCVVALNMVDVAEENGHHIDAEKLSRELGVPVVPVVASRGQGVEALRQRIVSLVQSAARPVAPRRFCQLSETFSREVETIAHLHARTFPACAMDSGAEALLILSDE